MLSKFIQQQRKKHNLTQEFLAAKIGVSRPTYMQIEQGERDLTITEAQKLAELFAIPFDIFLQGKEGAKVIIEVKSGKKQIKKEEEEIKKEERLIKKEEREIVQDMTQFRISPQSHQEGQGGYQNNNYHDIPPKNNHVSRYPNYLDGE